MTGQRLSAVEFEAADGVGDWQVLASGEAAATFRTGSFARGVELVVRIGELADAANHHPDIALSYPSVTVRMVTHDAGGLTDRDIALARQISATARALDVPAVEQG
jgi:pterin-4a-carbinolamine dehydratase